MKQRTLSTKDIREIDAMVRHFNTNQTLFKVVVESLTSYIASSSKLASLIHSTKQRIKDPEHLRAKLVRKFLEAKESGEALDYSVENLFTRVNDLAGFRIIHLHTTQLEAIHNELTKIFNDQRWIIVEGPVAKTWDDENRRYFRDHLSMATEDSESLYTSVHYVVQPNSRHEVTCELQVRTLMEEVWGEVDHTINYPEKSPVQACREQIKVLARMTSACSRLVDSIFLSSSPQHMTAGNAGTVPARKTSNARKASGTSPPVRRRATHSTNKAKPSRSA